MSNGPANQTAASIAASKLRIAVVGVSSLIGEAVIDELRARKLRSPNCMRSMTSAVWAGRCRMKRVRQRPRPWR